VKPIIMVSMELLLAKGETLQVRSGPHWIVYLRSIIVASLILIFATTLAAIAFESSSSKVTIYAALSAGAVAIAFGVLASATLQRNSQAVLVTDTRVIEVTGVLRHATTETRLSSVQTISVDQSIVGRLLNFGTVTLFTSNDEPIILRNIAFPLELQQALQDHRTRREDMAAGA
jgi:membrane protein YdbS with pleckstrin-like domain